MYLYDSGTDDAECRRKVESRRKVAAAIRSLVNVRVLHETLLVLVLKYDMEGREV